MRSPSVESDVTGVTGDGARSAVAYGSGKGVKRKGGRRGKRDISGSVNGLVKGGSERSITGDPGDEEDDEEDGGEGLMDDGEEMDKAAERKLRKATVRQVCALIPFLPLSHFTPQTTPALEKM